MAAKAKAKPKPAAPKAKETELKIKVPKTIKIKTPPAGDLTPDEQAEVGFFAKVVAGPHDGRYGVLHSRSGDVAVLRTRDDNDDMLLVDYEDLRPDTPGRR